MNRNVKIIIGIAALAVAIAGAFLAYNVLTENVETPKPIDSPTSDAEKTRPAPGKITAEQAKEMLSGRTDIILLDVRTEDEYRETHIEGAILIPDYEIASRAESELPDQDAVILVYCRSGRRSANAAKELADRGYTNVYDFGGIQDWPYETVNG